MKKKLSDRELGVKRVGKKRNLVLLKLHVRDVFFLIFLVN